MQRTQERGTQQGRGPTAVLRTLIRADLHGVVVHGVNRHVVFRARLEVQNLRNRGTDDCGSGNQRRRLVGGNALVVGVAGIIIAGHGFKDIAIKVEVGCNVLEADFQEPVLDVAVMVEIHQVLSTPDSRRFLGDHIDDLDFIQHLAGAARIGR